MMKLLPKSMVTRAAVDRGKGHGVELISTLGIYMSTYRIMLLSILLGGYTRL